MYTVSHCQFPEFAEGVQTPNLQVLNDCTTFQSSNLGSMFNARCSNCKAHCLVRFWIRVEFVLDPVLYMCEKFNLFQKLMWHRRWNCENAKLSSLHDHANIKFKLYGNLRTGGVKWTRNLRFSSVCVSHRKRSWPCWGPFKLRTDFLLKLRYYESVLLLMI
jgi:hypothetical protein